MNSCFKNFFLAAGLFFLIFSSAYAGVDANAYYGYTFSGSLNGEDVKGPVKGLSVHYKGSFLPMINMRIGGFYQESDLEYEINDVDRDATRKTAGMDLTLIGDFPVFHPYGRVNLGVLDIFEDEGKKRDIELFRAWGAGLGLEVTVVPFFRVFGEYRREQADHGADIRTDSAIFGIGLDF